MSVCLSLKTCKKKTYVEILRGFTIIVCTSGYWQFVTFEKNVIVIPAVLPPWSEMQYKYVQQSESLFMGLLTSSRFFVCLFWEPGSNLLSLKIIFYKMKLKLCYFAVVNLLE